ncbi:MAG: hypothetical protein U9R34_01850 [Nanoarchaeota archaeon]|nr:hypothetical protein [Nanoarchaeota archaeon]
MKNNDKVITSLNEFTKGQIIHMLERFIREDKAIRKEAIKFIDKNLDQFKKINKKELSLAKYDELWEEADEIISKFNLYGGGPEDEEEIVYDNLREITELFNQDNLDEYTKKKFIEKCIRYYFLGNSGFDDILIESIFSICCKKGDWLFVIQKLKEDSKDHSQDYTHDLIMRIYRHELHDYENYLKERMSDLKYGMDYYDLVTYFDERGDKGKAIEAAEEGLAKGEGRISDLIEFMLDYYKKQNDYQNTLKFMICKYQDSPCLGKYKGIKKFCKKRDWGGISKKLYQFVISRSYANIKADIDYHNKDYQLVLNYVQDSYGAFDDWAERLEPHFPKEILKRYMQIIHNHVETKKVRNYCEAAHYCRGVKRIFCKIMNNKEEWDLFIASLREKYPNLPALQRELRRL